MEVGDRVVAIKIHDSEKLEICFGIIEAIEVPFLIERNGKFKQDALVRALCSHQKMKMPKIKLENGETIFQCDNYYIESEKRGRRRIKEATDQKIKIKYF